MELVEAQYLQGICQVRDRHPDAFLTILWLGSSGGAGPWHARGAVGKGKRLCKGRVGEGGAGCGLAIAS